ncbi:MAG: hypothetical protein IPL79_18610 [Myxococcales bacterium]|nr:hypothetical protein [Myxococcales bacterium]
MGWWLFFPTATGASAAAVTAMFATRHPSRSITLAFLMAMLATLVLLRQLPSMARTAHEAGRLVRATGLYRWVARLTVRRDAAMRAQLCLAAVAMERGDLALAKRQLEACRAAASTSPAAQAVWQNNLAYLALRQGDGTPETLDGARASWQRFPHVDGFAHTYALACLQAGQVDTAIAVLEAMAPGNADTSLRAQRAWDLGRAWMAAGQPGYAARYQAEAMTLWAGGDAVPWYAAGKP